MVAMLAGIGAVHLTAGAVLAVQARRIPREVRDAARAYAARADAVRARMGEVNRLWLTTRYRGPRSG